MLTISEQYKAFRTLYNNALNNFYSNIEYICVKLHLSKEIKKYHFFFFTLDKYKPNIVQENLVLQEKNKCFKDTGK